LLDTVSVSRFLDDAAEILDAAERSLAADLDPSDYTILIDSTGSMRILSDCDWPLDSLQREHGSRTVYRVSRTGNSVRVEGREGSRSCVLESGDSRRATPQPMTTAPTWLLRQNCVARQILVSQIPLFQTLPGRA